MDDGPLPANLSLNTATGAIIGTPQPDSDGAYPITFRVTDGAGGTADKMLTLTILNTQSLGQWAGPFESPIVNVHGALLRNGTVVLWDALENGNDVHIWNPASNTFTATANSRTNIFCSGHCTLPDGRIFVAGGHVTTHIGLRDANIFDPGTSPATSSWKPADMESPLVPDRHDAAGRARAGDRGRGRLFRVQHRDSGDLQPGDEYLDVADRRPAACRSILTCSCCPTARAGGEHDRESDASATCST